MFHPLLAITLFHKNIQERNVTDPTQLFLYIFKIFTLGFLRLSVLLLLVCWLLRLLLVLLRLTATAATAHAPGHGVANNVTHCAANSNTS